MTGNWATAHGINERNQIVGEGRNSAGQSLAFIWMPYMINPKNLNDYLTSSQSASWVLRSASAINDQGRIVGWGTYGTGSSARTAAFLLYPN